MVSKTALRTALAAVLFSGLAGTGIAHADSHGGMASASMLANTCNGCHGPDGNSYGPASPSIAGMNDLYLTEALMMYKSGERPSTIMGRIAKGYSEKELEAIAKFFAGKKTIRVAKQKSDAKMVEMGQKITRDLCEGCHEKDGYAAEDYPILAGQLMPYLRNNLADFASGARNLDTNPSLSAKERRKKKGKLKDLHDKHGKDGVEAVVQFYGSRK
ncbi:c-type cytochrome [Magnetospira sp. QH-2]|uniref:c-type cytochrome n=1 Tax=Magnetospira sp. (strain QH-2) TaxID=1288970 RepID=UPI0003E80D8A|nr:c-type cytochrome [Magnetospira sp. QH-2]CCQ73749.1 Flavocytochrome [Magnetospira sp. QH-2]